MLHKIIPWDVRLLSSSRCVQGQGTFAVLWGFGEAEDRALDSFISARRECFNAGCPGRLTAFLMYAKKKSLDTELSSTTSLFVSL